MKIMDKICNWLDGGIHKRAAGKADVSELRDEQEKQYGEQDIVAESPAEVPDTKIAVASVTVASSQRRFSIAVLACVALYWLICLMTQSGNINAYFIFDHHDTGMDYFNMLANLSHVDPWCANSNYPAMCFLILRLFFRMIPLDVYADGVDGFALRENMIAQLGYILLTLFCLFVMWELLQHLAKGTKGEKILFAASLIFSGPMFFLLERGNLLLLSLASLLGYFALYDSPKRSRRYIGYVCLAFSASIKIYPAIFGLLVPMKKRWKETGHLIIIGIAVFLLPFFCFNGFDSLRAMFRGFISAANTILGFGTGYNYSFRKLLTLLAAMMGHYNETWPVWVLIVPLTIGLWIIIVGDQEWKKLFGMTLLCIWLPDFSYTYTLVFFFLPLVSFFCREREVCQFDTLYTVLFVLLMIPYMVPMLPGIDAVTGVIGFPASWATMIVNYVIIFFVFSILLEHYVGDWHEEKSR